MAKVLTSWKEIANYLGKGVRTVQRWESEFGLPIRRPMSKHHRAVLALVEELDAWAIDQRTTGVSELTALREEVVLLRNQNAKLRGLLTQALGIGKGAQSSVVLDDSSLIDLCGEELRERNREPRQSREFREISPQN